MPTELKVSSGADIQFEYGPDREKVRQVTAKGTMPATIDYVGGGLYENWMTATGTAQKNSLVTPNGLAAVVTRSSNLPDTVAYFHQDNLGSIVAMTDARGNLVQRYAYDAFGSRILAANPVGITGFGTQMGYTGHVQLDDLALVHMNGRVYDPVIGRFLSPDPNVQDPNDLQSLNRYSYVNNNPLSFTDPSGYFLSGFFHWFGHHWQMIAAVVVAIVASVVAQQWESWGWVAAMAGGFASGLIASNGNLQDGLIGAAAALAFYGIGYQFQNTIGVVGDRVGAFVQKVAEHGIVGGLASEAEGGRFASGFLGTAVPEVLSSVTNNFEGLDSPEKVAAAAVLGGTASVLGGGKFGNGALTAAFLEATADAAEYYKASVGRIGNPLPGENWPDQTTYTPDPETGRQPEDTFDMNVVGNNDLVSACRQGSVCSEALNLIPGLNATAGLHDYWFNAPGHPEFTWYNNVGTMLPATVISYSAIIGNLTQEWQNNPLVWYELSRKRN